MSVAYQHVHSDVPTAQRQRPRHTGGAGRPDRGSDPAGPGAAPTGRVGIPGRDGRDPLPVGSAPGADPRSAPRGAAPTPQPEFAAPSRNPGTGRRRHPVTVAAAPPPVLQRCADRFAATLACGPPSAGPVERAAVPDGGPAPANPPTVADRDSGGAAARPGRGGRWLVDRRPMVGDPGRCRAEPVQAEAMIRDAGLVPRVTIEHHNEVAPGAVAGTDPPAGTEQLRGSEVDVLVSIGRPEVPSIAAGTDPGHRERRAHRRRPDRRRRGQPPRIDDIVPVGAVLRTDPVAGTATDRRAPGHPGAVRGPAPVEVPDVTGKSAETPPTSSPSPASRSGPPRRPSTRTPIPGAVLGSSPAAGTEAPRGTAVSLKIADALTVPDVRGTSTKDAVETPWRRPGSP